LRSNSISFCFPCNCGTIISVPFSLKFYDNMAQSFSNVVKAYQEEMNLPCLPKGSFGRSLVGADGFPTNMFFGVLFSDHERDIKFLQECGLLKKEMLCPTCKSNMSLWKSERVSDKLRWWCGKGKRGQRCNGTRSLRHSSWFTKSKLHLVEIMLLTYYIIQYLKSAEIRKQLNIEQNIVSDWSHFCKEVRGNLK
jgi:transposase-like protein